MEHWNSIYDRYGCRMEPFKDKWEREFLGSKMEFGSKEDESTDSKPLRIDWLERRKRKTNFSSSMG
jgi:hypothetical protein